MNCVQQERRTIDKNLTEISYAFFCLIFAFYLSHHVSFFSFSVFFLQFYFHFIVTAISYVSLECLNFLEVYSRGSFIFTLKISQVYKYPKMSMILKIFECYINFEMLQKSEVNFLKLVVNKCSEIESYKPLPACQCQYLSIALCLPPPPPPLITGLMFMH